MISPEFLWTFILDQSLRASALIGCVLLLRLALGRWLPAQCFHLLWLLAAARLLCPVAPQSSWSAFNLFSKPAQVIIAEAAQPDGGQWRVRTEPVAGAGTAIAAVKPTRAAEAAPPKPWLAMLWLAGVGAQVLVLAVSTARMRRRLLLNAQPLEDAALLEVAGSCALQMGLGSTPRILLTDTVSGPAVTGLWRPRLLLPRGLVQRLSAEDLRFVLLHECAHLRRRDLLALWLLVAARILHWFNPLVWLAVRQARIDVELACDETVLKNTGTPQDYGQALLKLAQMAVGRPAFVPAMGIVQSRQSIRARLTRIGTYSPGLRRLAWVPAALLLAAVGLAFGADEKAPVAAAAPVAGKTESAAEAAPIEPAAPPVAAPVEAVPVYKAKGEGPQWARGWTVLGVAIPGRGKINNSQVELQSPQGRRMTLLSGMVSKEGVSIESITWAGEPVQAHVALRKGEEKAVLFCDAAAVSSDEKLKVALAQIEIESKFIEMPEAIAKGLVLPEETELPIAADAKSTQPVRMAILDKVQYQKFIADASGAKGVDLFSAPRVTTKSRQRAVIEIIREVRYPSAWAEQPKEAKVRWLPSAFETRNTGVTLEVEPLIGEDQCVSLVLRPQVVSLEGWVDVDTRKALKGPRPDSSKPLADRMMKPPGYEGAFNRRIGPVFSTRQVSTTVELQAGQSVVFVGAPETEELAPFKPSYAGRSLVVVITARLIGQDGREMDGVDLRQ